MEEEIDIFDYKLFRIFKEDEIANLSSRKKKKKNKNRKKQEDRQAYSLNEILNYPLGFFNDKNFEIVYDTDPNNSSSIHYVNLKVS